MSVPDTLRALHLQLQEVMVQGMWGNEILSLPHCSAELTEAGELLYFGPRVRIGMCEGVPTMVMPHTTSGRADFWGSFVNRRACPRSRVWNSGPACASACARVCPLRPCRTPCQGAPSSGAPS